MTKEDYMKLSKERLAELLVEKDYENRVLRYQPQVNQIQIPQEYDPRPLCGFGGYCTNPHYDCIGCPGFYQPSGQQLRTNFTTTGTINTEDKGE